jgi:hypothetical protein
VTDDIVEFIKARLSEDEQVARAANGPCWRPGDGNISEGGLYSLDGDGSDEARGWAIAWFELGMTNPGGQLPALSSLDRHAHANSVHAARHDPARVLREVEAKRRLLEWAQAQLDDFEDFPDDHQYRLEAIGVMRLHLPLLALPYSDHPGFREEWALPTS